MTSIAEHRRTAEIGVLARLVAAIIAIALVTSACAQSGTGAAGDLPEADPAAMAALLGASQRPVVLNIWGSWCVPCRSEAPLLRDAHRALGTDVRFIGIAVRDNQGAAQDFIPQTMAPADVPVADKSYHGEEGEHT